MQTSVLAKPDLKVFVLIGLLIAGFHAFVTSQRLPERAVALVNATEIYGGTELAQLLEKAASVPDASTFMKLGGHYHKTGQYKKAIFMMRNAQRLVEWEDE